jgi:CRISP-associated protein Cas1
MEQILNTLYVQTQGTYIHLDHETLKLQVEKETKLQVPLHHLGGIMAFGNVMMSPFLIHRCAEDGRSLVWLSEDDRKTLLTTYQKRKQEELLHPVINEQVPLGLVAHV